MLTGKAERFLETADIVVKNGNLVNVYSGKIYRADIAITNERIVYVGDSMEELIGGKTRIIDAKGKYLTPGLIESHVHTHESQMPVSEYARAILPHGTTTIVPNFYGEGVVGGVEAIRFFLDLAKKTPLRVYFFLPIAAYYQNRPFGHSGNITEKDLHEMLEWPECHGFGEAYVSEVLKKDSIMYDMIRLVKERKKVIWGHASEISGPKLQAWLNVVGRAADHESIRSEEAFEKHQMGIWIQVREGSACSDEVAVLKAITKYGANPDYFMFCVDMPSPIMMAELGYIDHNVRLAIRNGIDPMVAVQMATINAARYMRVDEYIGSVSPGKFADILLVDDLQNFRISMVIANGQIVARDGDFLAKRRPIKYPDYMFDTVKIPRPLKPEDFKIYVPWDEEKVRVRIIGVKDGTIITDELEDTMDVQEGELLPDVERDILKVVAIERHLNSGKIGKGFVRGFNLKRGAIGTTYNSQREDIIIVGIDDCDIAFAANHLKDVGGGFLVVDSGRVTAELQLPLLGLLSDEPFEMVVKKQKNVNKAARELGSQLERPFNCLAFIGMPITIGNLKITYQGLVRVWEERIVNLVVGH